MANHLGIRLARSLLAAALAVAAFRCVCFSLPNAALRHSLRVRRGHAREQQAGAGQGPRPIQGQPPSENLLGVLEVGIGLGMMIWSSGLLQARPGNRAGVMGRRASASPAEVAAPAAETAEPETPTVFDLSLKPGVCAPYGELGVSYWDPAGLAKDMDEAMYRQYRTAEIKHGRIAMLAVVGSLTQHGSRFPGFESVPSGFAAAEPGNPSAAFIGVGFILAGFIELSNNDEGREPGDFGDPFDLFHSAGRTMSNNENLMDWRNFELNHGRLAMIGIIGTFVAEYVTGLDAIEQWQKAGSASRRTFDLVWFPRADVMGLQDY